MPSRRASLLFALLAACGGTPAPGADAGSGRDAAQVDDTGASDAPALDDGGGPDAPTVADGGSSGCVPTSGGADVSMSCDLIELALLTRDGQPDEVRIAGRLFGASSGCAAIDGVDVLTGSTLVQHFDGGASLPLDSSEGELARGVPDASLLARCDSDENRFGGYGIVVTGRVDGGTFTARCADAEGGSRWPPALRITCHHNVADRPRSTAPSVMVSSFMGMRFSSTMLVSTVPHDAGGAITSVDATMHLIPQRSTFDPGVPLTPRDTGPWTGSVSESTPPALAGSSVSLFSDADPLGLDLCPPPETGPPGPGFVPPPVFLARITGTSGHGPFSTEIFANGCYTITTTPAP